MECTDEEEVFDIVFPEVEYGDEVIELLVVLHKQYKEYPFIDEGSCKVCYELPNNKVITIPVSDQGVMQIQSQYDKWLEYKDSPYSKFLNPVLEVGDYGTYMISPKLNPIPSYDEVKKNIWKETCGMNLDVEEAFTHYNTGMDTEGNIKSFDYGDYDPYYSEDFYTDLLQS